MGVLKLEGKWGFEYYDETGRRKRKVIEKSGEKIEGGWYEAAKRAYRDTKTRLDKGEPPLFSTSKKAFGEIAAKYLQVYTPKWSPKEAVRVRGMFKKYLLPVFGAKPIAKIRLVDIETYLARRRDEYVKKPCRKHQQGERCPRCSKRTSPTTCNKELMRLRHLFNRAIAWGELRQNPTAGIVRFKEPPEKVAYLEPEQRVRLLLACEAISWILRDIVIAAMTCGARLGEIVSMTWGQVDLKRRRVNFRKTKSNKVRYVPIHPDFFAVLLRMGPVPADPSATIFPTAWNGPRVSNAFKRAAKRAGLAWFRLHDCRHDFCSWLTMKGVPIRAVQKLAGHSDLRMTERYSHLSEQVLVEAVKALPAMPTLPSLSGEATDAAA